MRRRGGRLKTREGGDWKGVKTEEVGGVGKGWRENWRGTETQRGTEKKTETEREKRERERERERGKEKEGSKGIKEEKVGGERESKRLK